MSQIGDFIVLSRRPRVAVVAILSEGPSTLDHRLAQCQSGFDGASCVHTPCCAKPYARLDRCGFS
jgi:hypothetical protein